MMDKTIDAIIETADFGPAFAGNEYVTVTFRVHKDTRIVAGRWKLIPGDVGTFDWAAERFPTHPAGET